MDILEDQPHIANLISCDGDYIHAKTIYHDSHFENGGKKHGYRKEWNISHYSFTQCPRSTMLAYNITKDEYHNWEKQYNHVYDQLTKTWSHRNQ